MLEVTLDGYDAAALEIVARYENVTPDRLLCDLIREAAVCMVTGKKRRGQGNLEIHVADERTCEER